MPARWNITSGREATRLSAAPASARSPVCVAMLTPAIAGACGGTISCRSSAVILRPVSVPSLASRAISLRPTMPAAPVIRMRICKSLLFALVLAAAAQPEHQKECQHEADADNAGENRRDIADGQHHRRQ